MKCFYKVDDEEWREGEIHSLHNTMICFQVQKDGVLFHSICLTNPEIHFYGDGANFTGFRQLDGRQYVLTSVRMRNSPPNPGKENE